MLEFLFLQTLSSRVCLASASVPACLIPELFFLQTLSSLVCLASVSVPACLIPGVVLLFALVWTRLLCPTSSKLLSCRLVSAVGCRLLELPVGIAVPWQC